MAQNVIYWKRRHWVPMQTQPRERGREKEGERGGERGGEGVRGRGLKLWFCGRLAVMLSEGVLHSCCCESGWWMLVVRCVGMLSKTQWAPSLGTARVGEVLRTRVQP